MVGEQIRISLKAARVNAGYSQEDVSKLLHVSKTTIVNWETGKSEPKMTQARQLSELYKMPYDNIIFLPSGAN